MAEVEIHGPGVLETPTRKRRLAVRPLDVIVIAVITIVVIALVIFIIGRLSLKHEVSQAKTVSDKVIAALATQNTGTIRSLGDKKFQAKNSAASLSSALTFHPENSKPITFAQMYGDSTPTVDRQIVANNKTGQHVAIIYRYDKLKVPFFVRIETAKMLGSNIWTLQSLSASSNEAGLLE
jgi:hypothetical protein